ncbi:MAG: hypothetical protein ACOX5R_03680 [bacterium]
MRIPIPGSLPGQRARDPISTEQEKKIREWWQVLGGSPDRLIINRSSNSRCFLDVQTGMVHIGSDVNCGRATDPNSRMRWRAVVAHELRHQQRYDSDLLLSSVHLDEAITDLEACALPQLTPHIREELTADALQRLYLHVEEMKRETD